MSLPGSNSWRYSARSRLPLEADSVVNLCYNSLRNKERSSRPLFPPSSPKEISLMRFPLSLFVFTVAFLPLSAQTPPPAEVPKPIPVIKLERKEPVDFEKEIEPILVNRCEVCHGGAIKKGGYDISTYEGLIKGGKKGTAILP